MRTLSAMLPELSLRVRSRDGKRTSRRPALLRQVTQHHLANAGPAALLRYHDLLLFLAAFPGSVREKQLVENRLAALARCLRSRSSQEGALRRGIAGSGVAGSTVELAPSLTLLHWLLERAPADLAIVWHEDSPGAGFAEFVDALATPGEFDGLVDPRLTMRQWLDLARGGASEAAWLADRFQRLFDASGWPSRFCDALFDRMQMEVIWRLRAATSSRTLCRFPPRPLFTHTTGTPPPPSVDRVADEPLPLAIRARPADAARLIDVARCALAARGRETDPVTCANPREVLLYRLERGIDVLLLGLERDRRLPLETYVGYVAAKNRVPIAYGGGWCFLDQCTIGINVFESFRGGESLNTLSQIMRVYRHVSGARVMSVDPYQFGQDNEEAIQSGAFWFYWRAGFRPVERNLLALAEREAAALAADPSHRTTSRTLRRLATGRMRRRFVGPGTNTPTFIDPGDVSLALTRWIADAQRGDPERARRRGIERMTTLLHLDRDLAMRSPLAELVAMLDDLGDWSVTDRRAMRKLIEAKDGPRELVYLRRLRDHRRLRSTLERIARSQEIQAAGRTPRMQPR